MGRRLSTWVLGLILGGAAWAAPTPPSAIVPMVSTELLKSEAISDSLSFPGRVNSKINAAVLAEIDGVISEIVAPLGSRVKVNQKLFIIRHTDPVYSYAPSVLRASVEGVVSQVETTLGSRVTKGQRLGQITNPERLQIFIEVPAQELSSIRPDLEGEFRLSTDTEASKVFVAGVSPFVDPQTGTASVELHFSKKLSNPPAVGQIGKVSFQIKPHNGIQIAEGAVFYRNQKPMVRVIEKGKAKFIPVKLGNNRHGRYEILEGLSEGQKLITRASVFVGDGEEVKEEASSTAKEKNG